MKPRLTPMTRINSSQRHRIAEGLVEDSNYAKGLPIRVIHTICESFVIVRKFSGGTMPCRSAGFPTCCIADFKSAGRATSCDLRVWKPARQQTCPSPLRFDATAPKPEAKAGKSALLRLRLRRLRRAVKSAVKQARSTQELRHRFGLRMDLQFFVDAAQISLNRRNTQPQTRGDFFNALAARDAFQHFNLPCGEIFPGR